MTKKHSRFIPPGKMTRAEFLMSEAYNLMLDNAWPLLASIHDPAKIKRFAKLIQAMAKELGIDKMTDREAQTYLREWKKLG